MNFKSKVHKTKVCILMSISNIFIKVIHLVRDPRGIYRSMIKSPSTWADAMDLRRTCELMEDDLSLEKDLPESRYVRRGNSELSKSVFAV